MIACEHPDNPGRSLTDAAEDIAHQFAELSGAYASRMVWVESYAAERATAEPEFDRSTLTPAAAGNPLTPS